MCFFIMDFFSCLGDKSLLSIYYKKNPANFDVLISAIDIVATISVIAICSSNIWAYIVDLHYTR